MTSKELVCTLEQAKRLKELGAVLESYFSWFGDEEQRLMDNGRDGLAISNWVFVSPTVPKNNQEADWRSDVCLNTIGAAYTTSELLELIGLGTKEQEHLWQRLLNSINSNTGLINMLKPTFLADFLINQLTK